MPKHHDFFAFFNRFFKFEKLIFQESISLYIAQKRAEQPEKVKKIRKIIDYRKQIGFTRIFFCSRFSFLSRYGRKIFFPTQIFGIFHQKKIRNPFYNKCFCDHQLSNAPRFGKICEVLRDMEFFEDGPPQCPPPPFTRLDVLPTSKEAI